MGRSCVVRAVQRKTQSGRKEEDVHGTSEAHDRDLGTLDEPSVIVCITLVALQMSSFNRSGSNVISRLQPLTFYELSISSHGDTNR